MRRGPALVLGSLAVIFIAVIVAAVLGRGEDKPEETSSIYGDLATIETATAIDLEPINITDFVTLDPDSTAQPRGCREKEYTIQAGDYPADVAASFGVTLEALTELNPEQVPSPFIAGETLKIPCPPTPEPTEPPDGSSTGGPDDETSTPTGSGNTITYEVVAGDTAAAIAAKFGLTLEELAEANGTSVDALAALQIGDKLQIPNQ